jgi:hypothetical protein
MNPKKNKHKEKKYYEINLLKPKKKKMWKTVKVKKWSSYKFCFNWRVGYVIKRKHGNEKMLEGIFKFVETNDANMECFTLKKYSSKANTK